jgi:hypothetical protein
MYYELVYVLWMKVYLFVCNIIMCVCIYVLLYIIVCMYVYTYVYLLYTCKHARIAENISKQFYIRES